MGETPRLLKISKLLTECRWNVDPIVLLTSCKTVYTSKLRVLATNSLSSIGNPQ